MISTDVSRNQYTGNGLVSEYAYAFKITNRDQLLVTVRDLSSPPEEAELEVDVDFEVTDVGEEAGGTIQLQDLDQDWINGDGKLVDGYILTIRRAPSKLQETDVKNQDDFYPEVHEDEFDNIVMQIQDLQDQLSRSVKTTETVVSSEFDPTFPLSLVGVANRCVVTNADGDGLAVGPSTGDIEDAAGSATAAAASASAASSSAAAASASASAAASSASAAATSASEAADSATAVDDHIADTDGAHAASAISNTPSGNLVATNVQAGLNELQTDIDSRALDSDLTAHLSDATGAHSASAVSNSPSGNLASSDVQGALNELQSDIDTRALSSALTDHLNDTTAAHAAASISVAPAGNLAANDVQEALQELQGDIDTINAAPAGGGGGGSLRWVEGASAPSLTFENELEVYEFSPALAQEIFTTIRVPSTYEAGSPIALKILWYCASTANDALIDAVATLIRSEMDEITSTTNQRTTTNTAITLSAANDLEPQKVTLDLTDGSGQINGVAVSAGDLIKVKVKENSSTVADNVKLIFDASEVTFT